MHVASAFGRALALGTFLASTATLTTAGGCVGEDPAAAGKEEARADGGHDGSHEIDVDATTDRDATDAATPPPAAQDKVSWAHHAKTVGVDGSRVATDSNGYSVVLQMYTGSPPDVPEAAYSGFYIVRLDPSGKPVWTKGVPTQGTPPAVRSAVGGIAVDAAGDIYLSGDTAATLDFGNGVTVTGGGQYKDVGFVVKLDRANGMGVWKKQFASAGSAVHVPHLAVGGDHIAISGNFFESLAFDAVDGPKTRSGTGTFVARLDRLTGNATWLETASNSKTILAGGVAVNPAGDVYAGFWFNAAIVGWGNPVPLGTETDGLVIAFGPNGTPRWTRVLGKTGTNTIGSVKDIAFRANTLAFVGRTPAGIDFGDGKPLGTSGTSDPYVATLDPETGALRWARAIGNDQGGDDDEALSGVAVDDWGQVIVVGRYRKSLVIAGKALPVPSEPQVTAAFGAKLDSAGNFVWSKAVLASTWAHGESVATGPAGSSVATIVVNGSFDLGAGVSGTTGSANKDLGVVGWTP